MREGKYGYCIYCGRLLKGYILRSLFRGRKGIVKHICDECRKGQEEKVTNPEGKKREVHPPYCPRCGKQILHPSGRSFRDWTVWQCPDDGKIVVTQSPQGL